MKILLLSALLALLCRPSAASDVDAGMDVQADDCVRVEPGVVQPVELADIRVLNFNVKFRTRKFLRKPDHEALYQDVVQNESDVANIHWHVLAWACGLVDIPADVGDVTILERIKCQ